jgi:hypothetical protein
MLKTWTTSLRLKNRRNINFSTHKKSIKLFNHKENLNLKILKFLKISKINNKNKYKIKKNNKKFKYSKNKNIHVIH